MLNKQRIIKLINPNMLRSLVKIKKNIHAMRDIGHHKVGCIRFCDNRAYHIYQIPGKNVFFGYYDIKQFDDNTEILLAHVVDLKAIPGKNEAELVWFQKNDNHPHIIDKTAAWCWQQGSRLRWHPTDVNCVLYNACEGDRYICKYKNLENGDSKTLSRALYDITPDGKYGISLNFSRLQRLRPGYGYSVLPDSTSTEIAPTHDGVIIVDLTTGKEKLLYSLSDLANSVSAGDAQHYINHISINPSGQKFIFFHIWTDGPMLPWSMRLYVSDIHGENLKLLVSEKRVSHYCWINDEAMIITTSEGLYYRLDVADGKMELIESYNLTRDGHPNWLINGILSDTYPLKNGMQNVFRINADGSGYKEIVSVYSDPRFFGDKRCDLHPRISAKGDVCFDSTVMGGCRSIIQFSLNESEFEYVQG